MELPHNIPIQIAWTLATIAILYAVLQIREKVLLLANVQSQP